MIDKRCPDDGRCHHSCGAGPCFRVQSCGPLSAAGFPDAEWPAIIVELHGLVERMLTFANDLDAELDQELRCRHVVHVEANVLQSCDVCHAISSLMPVLAGGRAPGVMAGPMAGSPANGWHRPSCHRGTGERHA